MKRKLVILLVVITGLIGLAGFILAQDGFDIKIANQTKNEISGIYLTYDHITSDIKIPPVAPGEEYKLNVDPAEHSMEDFDEAALVLEYKDYKGKIHTEYVIGYFEKGYSGEAIIQIKSVNNQGKIEVDIQEDTSLY